MEEIPAAPEPKKCLVFPRFKPAVFVGVVIVLIGLVGFLLEPDIKSLFLKLPIVSEKELPVGVEIKRFTSEQDIKNYLAKGSQNFAMPGLGTGATQVKILGEPQSALGVSQGITPEDAASSVQRTSETNVQVPGIDEPDIVKISGNNIYFSPQANVFYPMRGTSSGVGVASPGQVSAPSTPASGSPVTKSTVYPMPSVPSGETKIISAFPPQKLSQPGKIDKSGDLLLEGSRLAVFAGGTIYAYDVSDPANPKQAWQMSLNEGSQLAAARFLNGKLYLVISQSVNRAHPCPLTPLDLPVGKISIPCTDIYYPTTSTAADTTYTASRIDFRSGSLEKSFTFLGASASSVTYMSPDALYITYGFYPNQAKLMLDFFTQKGVGLLPEEMLRRLQKLSTLDISDQAKLTEIGVILNGYENSLSDNQRLKMETDLQNRLKDYTSAHLRELSSSGIVKASLGDFTVEANGTVPGILLNQFSLDEYQGNLRLATTISGSLMGESSETVNDVYVLDDKLQITGSIKDLGKGERIFSARFVGGRGYIVTFKQTDPFFVLDLSDPQNPAVTGELSIPGFSSYLDPLEENTILGVGRDGHQVKLSLFDVSSPQSPQEIAKYNLDEYYTDVQNNPHAFLKDPVHKIFFIPGSKGGYIFSYDNGLTLRTAVDLPGVRRAAYINDYLYLLSDQKMAVISEKDWNSVSQFSFE